MKGWISGTFLVFLILLAACQPKEKPAPGIPDRSPELDVLPGFRNPPPGYGEVPFWWWTGDTLNTERLTEQVRELHKKGISGVQVNYSHHDTPGWPTDFDQPEIFSDRWWEVYSRVSEVCGELDMGIGLSTYTIDWPNGANNLFYKLFYSKEHLNAFQLETGERLTVSGGQEISRIIHPDVFSIRAWPLKNGKPVPGGIDLSGQITGGYLKWTVPDGEWEIRTIRSVRKAGTLNPLMAGSGDTVISGFFQQFEDHAPGRSSRGLNYFFNDELQVGAGKLGWNPDFPSEFLKRKGYDLLDYLPALWSDMGDITPKVRMDYADVRMSLMEERYFIPIYEWHAVRGLIYGCDSGGRGLDPEEFGDYFRATRWYTAPGHDTPGGRADLIKGKVSSSIANLYQRPRVWLEGYHSLGWGATPEQIMYATLENYLYGCSLLNLHGFYYTTYGSWWEWAPPCYHFRMPYWGHMGTFLDYFERLSYLMSQGHLVSDVAVVYPVAPYEAGLDGNRAREAAFATGRRLMAAGINFEFIDNESLGRAVVENGLLKVKEAGAAYRVLVFPDMEAVRWPSIEKAAQFSAVGGMVIAVGQVPSVSDHAGRNDPELDRLNALAFPPERRLSDPAGAVDRIRGAFRQDVDGLSGTVRAVHRKAGFRDVYLVMDAKPGQEVEFRSTGSAERWDPWTGKTEPLKVVSQTADATRVVLTLEPYEAILVVFTPDRKQEAPEDFDLFKADTIRLDDEWNVAFEPTMDNSRGDFRLPVTDINRTIGTEARRFAWSRETGDMARNAMLPSFDDSGWERKLCGFGTQFMVQGPDQVWKPYDFSWRWGREGDPGHQGYHGLKRTVTDDFLCLGDPVEGLNETLYVGNKTGNTWQIATSVSVEKSLEAELLYSGGPPADESHHSAILQPSVVLLNGDPVDPKALLKLREGVNRLVVRFDHAGRGHLVLRRKDVTPPAAKEPLSMRWANDPGVIPFDVYSGERKAEWFRFVSAPGTCSIRVQAEGKAEAWINGIAMEEKGNGVFAAKEVPAKASLVALRIVPERPGLTGGGLIPEPVVVQTDGSGLMNTGDWSNMGILNNYSGGVLYRKSLNLTRHEAGRIRSMDLGSVAGTAEVYVNGKSAGVRVAPPWKFDIRKLVIQGENRIEIRIFNTLANHYQTIPSRYKGNPRSGLLGPVVMLAEQAPADESSNGIVPGEDHRRSAWAVIDPVYSIDKPKPSPLTVDGAPWLYGPVELESYRHQLLRVSSKNVAHNGHYPGIYHTPYFTAQFRKIQGRAGAGAADLAFRANGDPEVWYRGRMIYRSMHSDNLHVVKLEGGYKGNEELLIRLRSVEGPPALQVEGGPFSTLGDGWEWQAEGTGWQPAAAHAPVHSGIMPHEAGIPEVTLDPVGRQGDLYDFGRPIIGKVTFLSSGKPSLIVGESSVEASDTVVSRHEQILTLESRGDGRWISKYPLAFRFVRILNGSPDSVRCLAQFWPSAYRGAFASSDSLLTRIWMASAYTHRLNKYEFMLDGIKRDRLPWVDNMMISSMVESMTLADPGIIRRTLAVLGRESSTSSINGIIDYDCLWLISQDAFQQCFDDPEFLKGEWPRIRAMVARISKSCDSDGLRRWPDRSWIFIDWVSGWDKNMAEQVMWWWALESSARLAGRMGETAIEAEWREQARKLKTTLNEKAWDPVEQAWTDPDKKIRPTRHGNLLSMVSGLTEPHQVPGVMRVLEGSEAEPVNSPSMITYEVRTLAQQGKRKEALEKLRSIWGGMLESGLNTFWEGYDPNETGNSIFAFYDRPYGKSMCHAWGAGPVFLIPEILFGIKVTGDGWKSFEINPVSGLSEWSGLTVPTRSGNIQLKQEGKMLHARIPSGVQLSWKGRVYRGPITISGSVE